MPEDKDKNPIQQRYDDTFNGLRRAENEGTVDKSLNEKPDKSEGALKMAEETPDTNWNNNVVGLPKGKTKSKGFFKKKGPLTFLIFIFGGSLFGLVNLSAPMLLTQSIAANLVQKLNIQETSFTLRTNKLIASKMSEETTSGVCKGPITIVCKFSRPSNRFLGQLEKNGIQALNKEGEVITKNGLFPNQRPALYKFTSGSGETIEVEAKDLYKTLMDNAEFRDAFHKSSKSRFMTLTDEVFDSIKQRFGFGTSDQLANIDDAAENADDIANNADDVANNADDAVTSVLDDASMVDDGGVSEAIAQGGDAVDDAARESIEGVALESTEQLDDIGRSGGGNAIGLIGAGVCLATDVPGLITRAVRNFQMLQLIRYSAVFLSAFGAIKAGDASPKETSAIGDMLTQTVNGKSAMDSFGMNYVINGQTASTKTFKKFVPGGSIVAALGGVIKVTDSDLKKQGCAAAVNPITGEAINGGLALAAGETLGATLIAMAGNMVLGLAISAIAAKVAPPIISAVINHLPMDKIMNYFVGDLTKDLKGEPVGDALVSGASHIMSQTANDGGNMPLTVNQAIAYEQTTKQVQLAYAEEDRATKSPFDASNPNTMLGSIVSKIAPYLASTGSSMGSVSGTLAALGRIVSGSFGVALQPMTVGAADPGSEYKMCDDPAILDKDVAAGPFCNIIYGVPNEYLDKDPIDVVNSLVQTGNVDPDTGNPVKDSDLEKWQSLCTTGTTDQANNCKIKDEKRAEYALYTIDHRVQKTMDEELPLKSATADTSFPGVTQVSNPIDGAATICIDPGHPPKGAPGEPAYTLKTALALQTELQSRGYNVVLTRTDSNDVSIPDRPKKCADAKANLLYSIHGENDGAKSNHPFTIYMKSDRNQSTASKKYADIIQKAMVSSLNGMAGMQGKQGICMEGSCTALSSLGVFSGADDAGIPAVMSEVVRSNNDGSSAIDDPKYLKKLVTGIANGIQEIFPISNQPSHQLLL